MIEKIESLHVDYEQMRADYESVLYKALPNGWDQDALIQSKQINVRGEHFISPIKSENLAPTQLEYKKFFMSWHKECPQYTKNIINDLCHRENFEVTRARYLCQSPGRGLSFHQDGGIRYHFVLETNIASLFFFVGDKGFPDDLKHYHLQCSNHFYKVDTTKTHFVYNAGHTNRIHLVIS